jgi:hypothetical protein
MIPFAAQRQEADFRRVTRVKTIDRAPAVALGPEMVTFFKQSVQKRQTKLSKIGETFATLVPETLTDHCALDSLSRGTLTVLVDSASHLYELKQLLLAGVEKQLTMACKSAGLKKIVLKPGRWYEERDPTERKLRFDK